MYSLTQRQKARAARELHRRRELNVTGDNISRVHLPAYLQDVAISYTNTNLIAERICPTIPVDHQTDKYRIFGRNAMQTGESRWRPGTIPNEIKTRWSDDQYFCDIRKIRTPIYDAERGNADGGLSLEVAYTEVVTNYLDIGREVRVAALFTTASNYISSHKIAKAGGSEWDQSAVAATIQPILDMQAVATQVALDAMVSSSALTVIIPKLVYDIGIKNNTQILARMNVNATRVVTTDLLASLLDVKEVIVADSVQIPVGPETADADVVSGYTPQYVWGDTVWIGLVAAGQNIGVPFFARTYGWTGAMAQVSGMNRAANFANPAAPSGVRAVTTYRMADEGQKGDWIECTDARSEKLGETLSGGIITNCLSTI